jgi:ribosomal protein S18 acetylase RimI-like enzyme
MAQTRTPGEVAARPTAATTLWRVRVALPDRPGTLARVALACGAHGVNILALEVLPGVGGVTDELVLAVPASWDLAAVVRLVEEAGGRPELVGPAPASALADQTVRHLRAVSRLVERPLAAAGVVAALLEADISEANSETDARRADRHHLVVSVDGENIDLVREAPFTPTEQARVDAVVGLADRLADLVSPLDPSSRPEQPVERTMPAQAPPEQAPGRRSEPELRSHADLVIAEVDDRKVGEARLSPSGAGWGVRVYVHPAWRRRGIGGRLLRDVMAMAADRGIRELDVRLDAHDLAGLRLVLASGMCGSISCDGEQTRTRLVLGGNAVRV